MDSPFASIIKFIELVFLKRLKSDKNLNGLQINIEGQRYLIFRNIKRNDNDRYVQPVILVLRFRFPNSSLKKDKFVSLLQIPVFVGINGFMAKLWSYDNDNDYFQGVYQWSSLKTANDYLNSYAVNYVKAKALKNSVAYELYENMEMDEFISRHKDN